MDTKALRQFGYGVYLVTALDADGRACGCVVNTGMQLTSDPYRVMVAINRDNATYAAIKATRRFAVTCLTEAADMDLVGTFGFRRSDEFDKFAAFETAATASGIPYVVQAAGSVVECAVMTTVDVGTHEVVVGDVTDAIVVDTAHKPMTYAYYHGVLKGTTPPKASAFIADEGLAAAEEPVVGAHFAPSVGAAPVLVADIDEDPDFDIVGAPGYVAPTETREFVPVSPVDAAPATAKHHFRCMLCGYVVETEAEELPEGFRCPMCGAGPDRFVRID